MVIYNIIQSPVALDAHVKRILVVLCRNGCKHAYITIWSLWTVFIQCPVTTVYNHLDPFNYKLLLERF
jgi:hypothetical protein